MWPEISDLIGLAFDDIHKYIYTFKNRKLKLEGWTNKSLFFLIKKKSIIHIGAEFANKQKPCMQMQNELIYLILNTHCIVNTLM